MAGSIQSFTFPPVHIHYREMRVSKRHHSIGSEREAILSNLRALLQAEEPVQFAYVYGSFERSSDRGFNDIDIAVQVDEKLFPDEGAFFSYGLRLAAQVDLAIEGYEVDLQVLNLVPLSFKLQVIQTGSVLFSRDELKRITFEVRTRDLYFDFLPHRKTLYRALVLGESVWTS